MLDKKELMENIIPTHFYLSQNYPNPFRETTTIKYCIAYKTKVKLKVYDEEHKEIETLVDEEKDPGTYEVVFNVAQDSSPVKVNTSYYYRLEAGDYKFEKEMEIIR